jgi:hypothetical protein
MKYLKTFDSLFEKLNYTDEFRSALKTLNVYYNDRVSTLLLSNWMKNWEDNEDINQLSIVAQDIHFLPANRRNISGKSQSIKAGKLAKTILSKVFPKLELTKTLGEFRYNQSEDYDSSKPDYTLVIPLSTFDNQKSNEFWRWKELVDGVTIRMNLEFIEKPLFGKEKPHKFSAIVKAIWRSSFTVRQGILREKKGVDCAVIEFDTAYEKFKPKKYNNDKVYGGVKSSCKFSDVKLSLSVFNDKDIEDFSNRINALMSSKDEFKIEEVKGEEIKKWYSHDNTARKTNNDIAFKSCMSTPSKQHFLDLYSKNPNQVSLLIMKNDNNKLLGRALLWKLSYHEDGKKYFMDTIYSADRVIQNMFEQYAKEKGYETNTQNGMEVQLFKYQLDYYPYLDTLYYFNRDTGQLMNYYRYFKLVREDKLKDKSGKKYWFISLRSQNGGFFSTD